MPSRRSWFPWFGSKTIAPEQAAAAPLEETTASLIVKELEALKSQYPGQVKVDYYLDEENRFIRKDDIFEAVKSSGPVDDSLQKKLILVSGPEGFLGYMAGPKVWAQGQELQGPVQGVIKELDLKEWAVWKL
jgi:hypothetical protein